jgi:nucleotide-binding universal stress UspA family protein
MRILIPVDGRPECEKSIPVAQQLASTVDAEFCLVRVIEVMDAFSPLRFDPDIRRMLEDAARYLDDLVARYELPADRTQCLVGRNDNAAKEIITIAQNNSIDLIVMSSHCKGWLRRLTRGSVCREVVISMVCPVVSMPAARAKLHHERRGVLARRL